MFDLIIRNGLVIDGTGRPAYRADVGVTKGTITDMGIIPISGSMSSETALEIDATGQIVAPGFIDIHTHADIALLARPAHLPKVMQGVTTEVFTNCGLGFAPVTGEGLAIQRRYLSGLFGDDGNSSHLSDSDSHPVDWNWRTVAKFLAHFEKAGIGANIAYLIPHGSARVSVMGMEERPAEKAELDAMLKMVEQGMEEGAWGMSTGIWYAPMRSAGREELVTLFRAAGFFATHQRDYGEEIFAATQESIEIAREAGVPVQISHLQMNGAGNAGRAPEILALIEGYIAQGVDVSCDTYPYTAGSTFIQALLPAWAVDSGPEGILEHLADLEDRSRIELFLVEFPADWNSYTLVGAQSAINRSLEGLSFQDASKARKLSPAAFICAVLEEEELRACYVHHAAHEGNVRDILRWPAQMVGSDGLHLPGKTHPRLYGTFPRVLGHYVREEKVITLEEAVYKMTGQPAARLGLKQRGTISVGNAADIVIFDPATVSDTATFDDPLRYPTGIPHVFVNGKAVKLHDQPTYTLPGQVLRRV